MTKNYIAYCVEEFKVSMAEFFKVYQYLVYMKINKLIAKRVCLFTKYSNDKQTHIWFASKYGTTIKQIHNAESAIVFFSKEK